MKSITRILIIHALEKRYKNNLRHCLTDKIVKFELETHFEQYKKRFQSNCFKISKS